MGLVREDGHGDALSVELFEKLKDTGVGGSAAFPVSGVVLLESCHNFVATICELSAEGTPDEGFYSVTNVAFDGFVRVGRETKVFHGMVERRCDSGEGIDKGAIEIKNKSANHGAAIIGYDGIFEPCFDRVGRLWK